MAHKKNFLFLIILYPIIGWLFYNLFSYNFLMSDDYLNLFMRPIDPENYKNFEGINPNIKIKSITDIVHSQYNAYLSYNGRAIFHGLSQFFCSLVNKSTFNVLNSIIFCLFIYSMGLMAVEKNTRHVSIAGFLPVVLFLLIFSEPTCLYRCITYSILYLWTPTFVFLLWFYFKSDIKTSIIFYPVLCLVSFLIGWSHEGLSIPFAGAYLASLLINKKFQRADKYCILIFFLLGTLFLICSPGNAHRADGTTYFAKKILSIIPHVKSFYILTLILTLLLLKSKYNCLKFIKGNIELFIALALALLLAIFAGAVGGPRSCFGVEILSILLIVKLLYNLIGTYFINYLSFFSITYIIMTFILLSPYQKQEFDKFHKIQKQMALENDCNFMTVLPNSNISCWLEPLLLQYWEPYAFWNDIIWKLEFKKSDIFIIHDYDHSIKSSNISVIGNTYNSVIVKDVLTDSAEVSITVDRYNFNLFPIGAQNLLNKNNKIRSRYAVKKFKYNKRIYSEILMPNLTYLDVSQIDIIE